MTASRKSLRTQLIAWNIVALSVLFIALGGVIRYMVRSFMLTAVDRELRVRAQRAMGPPPPRPQRPQRDNPDGRNENPPQRRESPPQANPPPPVNAEEQNENGNPADPPDPNHPMPQDNTPNRPQRYTLGGQPFDSSGNGEWHTIWDKAAFDQAVQGATLYSTIVLDGEPYRVLSRPFPPNSPPDGVIQAPYPLAEVNTAIAGLDRALLTLIPIGLLCAGWAGAWLTDRVPAPRPPDGFCRRADRGARPVGAASCDGE